MLVLQTRAKEVLAAGFQEVNLLGVMNTGFVPRTECCCLSACRMDTSIKLKKKK